jgi:hypothetical protein
MTERKRPVTQKLDEIVIAQADNDEAWEPPVSVQVDMLMALALSPKLAARAAFLAHLHQAPDVEGWLMQIIEERIEFEENAFAGLKRVMEEQSAYKTKRDA